jgi:hypothetical protein
MQIKTINELEKELEENRAKANELSNLIIKRINSENRVEMIGYDANTGKQRTATLVEDWANTIHRIGNIKFSIQNQKNQINKIANRC